MNSNSELSHLPAQSTKLTIINRAPVSDDNLQEIRGVTAAEQHEQIKLGDVISVVFFHNVSLGCSGTVTIWHNRNQATVKTNASSHAGEWLEPLKLVVFDEEEQGWTRDGELVIGSLAMDLNGIQGIYSCGEFYRNHVVDNRAAVQVGR